MGVRAIHHPRVDQNDKTFKIEQGGTGKTTATEAAEALDLLTTDLAGKPNGYLVSGTDGKIDRIFIPPTVNVNDMPKLDGPVVYKGGVKYTYDHNTKKLSDGSEIELGNLLLWRITNYDSSMMYSLTSSNMLEVSIDVDIVKAKYNGFGGTSSVTINGFIWNIKGKQYGPAKPSIIAPSNESISDQTAITIQSSPFSGTGPDDTHVSSTFQVSELVTFSTFIKNETVTTNKTSYSLSGLENGKSYYVRVAYTNPIGTSMWSDTIFFMVNRSQTPTVVVGNIQVSAKAIAISNNGQYFAYSENYGDIATVKLFNRQSSLTVPIQTITVGSEATPEVPYSPGQSYIPDQTETEYTYYYNVKRTTTYTGTLPPDFGPNPIIEYEEGAKGIPFPIGNIETSTGINYFPDSPGYPRPWIQTYEILSYIRTEQYTRTTPGRPYIAPTEYQPAQPRKTSYFGHCIAMSNFADILVASTYTASTNSTTFPSGVSVYRPKVSNAIYQSLYNNEVKAQSVAISGDGSTIAVLRHSTALDVDLVQSYIDVFKVSPSRVGIDQYSLANTISAQNITFENFNEGKIRIVDLLVSNTGSKIVVKASYTPETYTNDVGFPVLEGEVVVKPVERTCLAYLEESNGYIPRAGNQSIISVIESNSTAIQSVSMSGDGSVVLYYANQKSRKVLSGTSATIKQEAFIERVLYPTLSRPPMLPLQLAEYTGRYGDGNRYGLIASMLDSTGTFYNAIKPISPMSGSTLTTSEYVLDNYRIYDGIWRLDSRLSVGTFSTDGVKRVLVKSANITNTVMVAIPRDGSDTPIYDIRFCTTGAIVNEIATPSVITPVNNYTLNDTTVSLKCSAFSSSNALDTLQRVEWQISESPNFLNVFWTSPANLTSVDTTCTTLSYQKTYYIRVRHHSSRSTSLWSGVTKVDSGILLIPERTINLTTTMNKLPATVKLYLGGRQINEYANFTNGAPINYTGKFDKVTINYGSGVWTTVYSKGRNTLLNTPTSTNFGSFAMMEPNAYVNSNGTASATPRITGFNIDPVLNSDSSWGYGDRPTGIDVPFYSYVKLTTSTYSVATDISHTSSGHISASGYGYGWDTPGVPSWAKSSAECVGYSWYSYEYTIKHYSVTAFLRSDYNTVRPTISESDWLNYSYMTVNNTQWYVKVNSTTPISSETMYGPVRSGDEICFVEIIETPQYSGPSSVTIKVNNTTIATVSSTGDTGYNYTRDIPA